MSPIWLFGSALFVSLLGIGAGWWLRGRGQHQLQRIAPCARQAPKNLAEQTLQGLHAAAESVRSCVEQHIECIRAIEAELRESSATEPAIISNAADSIIAANGLVQHQFTDIQRLLDHKEDDIQDHLDDPFSLFLTFASLDRQKHVYRQVLRSLELLAAELIGNMEGHGQRLQQISHGLEEKREELSGVTAAVSQIFDATDEIHQKMEAAEYRIDQQAQRVEMQAVLSHTDLLTSLPNRRAFEAELQQQASRTRGKGHYSTVVLVDLHQFDQVNSQYGHHGGDVILRQAANVIKQLMRGKDMVARYSGDTYGLLLTQTTLHDALPIAERVRTTIEQAEFSHGSFPLRLTANVGIAQLQPEETTDDVVRRAAESLREAKHAGGNACYWHDGNKSYPVSSAFKSAEGRSDDSSDALVAMFRQSISGDSTTAVPTHKEPSDEDPNLSGRSLFIANLQRRLSEWKRGGPTVAVFVLRVDQMEQLVSRFGGAAESFLHSVMARLLEAVTRDMDERCEFENGVFAILLPGLDETNALAVAERLQSQVRQCKVRIGDALWNVTASIGLSTCASGTTVVEVMRSAESAMKKGVQRGGDTICIGEAAPQSAPVSAIV
jgi:diguanylate cyclase (GGDEF)-like protein